MFNRSIVRWYFFFVFCLILIVFTVPVKSDELPPPNPEWSSSEVKSYKAKRLRLVKFVENCRSGDAKQCFFAGVNFRNAGLAYSGNASVPSYPADNAKAAAYYRTAAKYHRIGCSYTGKNSGSENCRLADTSLRIANQLVNPTELPAANPKWPKEDIEYHNGQRRRFRSMIENCDKGIVMECYYAGNNLFTAARGYSGTGTVRTYKPDKAKEVEYYKLALEYHTRACNLSESREYNASCTDIENIKWRIALIEDPVGQKQRDLEAKKDRDLARERRNRVADAVRQYINKDCSRIRLLGKTGDSNAVALTSLTSSMSVENGYCVAKNGITTHTIGVSSVYGLKCDSETARKRRCSFGYNVSCEITSQFGNRGDNDRISDWFCRSVFGGVFKGNGVFSTSDGGKTLNAVSLKLR